LLSNRGAEAATPVSRVLRTAIDRLRTVSATMA
jgi:hypothetical protein